MVARPIKLLITFILILLSGYSCMPVEKVEEYLLGSWEGEGEHHSWCMRFDQDDDAYLAVVFLSIRDPTDPEAKSMTRGEGTLTVKKGRRYRLVLTSKYDVVGDELPAGANKYKDSRLHIISEMHKESYVYQSSTSDVRFTNTRVENCDVFEADFLAYIEK